jgi:serine phosphatase RsbU (regulator of sigma subunit)
LYVFYHYHLGRLKNANLQDLLWKVFVTGLIATILSLGIKLFEFLFRNHKVGENPLFINFIYFLNLGLILAFLLSTFVVWERFIFYQKSKRLVYSWKSFIYLLAISLFLIFLNIGFGDPIFYIILGISLIISIYFSVNLKWVAYLNYKQKWKSILLFILVAIYLGYFFNQVYQIYLDSNDVLILDLLENITTLIIFIFVFVYAITSILVLLFNLPTSSVFEKKLEEIINFQRLSQSRNTGKNKEEVYEILLESSVSAVMADAAWLDINQPGSLETKQLKYKIKKKDISDVLEHIPKGKIKKLLSTDPVKNLKTNRYIASIRDYKYRSILVFPIYIQNDSLGTLNLLKEISDGFNDEMIDIIGTFINQASISIENFNLIDAAVENERYKKELNIAKTVQRNLLPTKLKHRDFYEIIGYSESADEVGGDYSDIFEINGDKTIIIIGDVSGKGTSAAFHMSQLKGIFHSLVQLQLSPKDFLIYANNALAKGLDKNSFITAAYYIIDKSKGSIEFSRAGHCPTLYYDHSENSANYFYGIGLGLGIIRNNEFYRYVNIDKIKYNPKDILVLFTDGITEARNDDQEEFGYDRLKNIIVENAKLSPDEIKESIFKAMYSFRGSNALEDDSTLIIIKFKENKT